MTIPAGGFDRPVNEDFSGGRGGAITALLVIKVNADRPRGRPGPHNADDHIRRCRTAAGCRSPGRFLRHRPWLNVFESSIQRVDSDGVMVSSWYMPYHKSVQIRLTNSSGQGRSRSWAAMSFDREPPPETFALLPCPLAISGWIFDQEGRRHPGLARVCGFQDRLAGSSGCS